MESFLCVKDLNELVEDALNALVVSLGGWPSPLQLCQAPWKKSLTFGVHGEWLHMLEAVRHCAALAVRRLDREAWIREDRELHMSWH